MSGYNPVSLTDPETGERPAYTEESRDEENPPAGAPIFSAKSLQPGNLSPEAARWVTIAAAAFFIFIVFVILGKLFGGSKGDLSSLYHELHEVKEELEDLTKEIKRLKLAIEKGH